MQRAYEYSRDTIDKTKSAWLENLYGLGKESLLRRIQGLAAIIAGKYYVGEDGRIHFGGAGQVSDNIDDDPFISLRDDTSGTRKRAAETAQPTRKRKTK
jgi:hypothetical protein